MNVELSGAPRNTEFANESASSWLSSADAGLVVHRCVVEHREQAEEDRHLQEERQARADSGLVPVFLYSSIVSRDIASREYWSFLPLYLSWIFLSCGATSSMRRWLLIWRTKIGISAARTTMHEPDDREHPGDAGVGVEADQRQHGVEGDQDQPRSPI